jgi:hypothetical protein
VYRSDLGEQNREPGLALLHKRAIRAGLNPEIETVRRLPFIEHNENLRQMTLAALQLDRDDLVDARFQKMQLLCGQGNILTC